MSRNLSDFESHHRRIILIMMPVGALACLLGRWLSHQPNLFDTVFEPLLATLLGILTVLMGFRLVSLRFAEAGLVTIIALYQLFGLTYYSVQGDLFRVGLSATAMWFPVLYALAYLTMTPWGAAVFSLAYSVSALLVVPLGWGLGHRFSGPAVNSVVQFYLVNLVYLALIGFYARYQQEHARLKRLAHSDPLTGLANRRRAEELVALELARVARYPQPFSVLVLDLDHFKQINDQYGHAVGDQVLREVGLRFSKAVRETDVLARWGGEEFLVFAPNTDGSQARGLAERLVQALASEPLGGSLQVTTSVGIATSKPGDTVEELVSRADRAMYEAKAQGRNRIVAQLVGN